MPQVPLPSDGSFQPLLTQIGWRHFIPVCSSRDHSERTWHYHKNSSVSCLAETLTPQWAAEEICDHTEVSVLGCHCTPTQMILRFLGQTSPQLSSLRAAQWSRCAGAIFQHGRQLLATQRPEMGLHQMFTVSSFWSVWCLGLTGYWILWLLCLDASDRNLQFLSYLSKSRGGSIVPFSLSLYLALSLSWA